MKHLIPADRLAKGLYWSRAWSLVSGCTPVSPGCDHCWAAAEAHTRRNHPSEKIKSRNKGLTDSNGKWTGAIRLNEHQLTTPSKARKPAVWAIWTDLFHRDVPDTFINQSFVEMSSRPDHVFLVLTKRPFRMAEHLITHWQTCSYASGYMAAEAGCSDYVIPTKKWPPQNVLVGTTAETQEFADLRRPAMIALADAGWKTWVSSEPRLRSIDWSGWELLSWLVTGGESGRYARPCHPGWLRSDRDWCSKHNIPWFFKQWGQWIPRAQAHENGIIPTQVSNPWGLCQPDMARVSKYKAGRTLDGREHQGFPE